MRTRRTSIPFLALIALAVASFASAKYAEEPFEKSDPPGALPVLLLGRAVDSKGHVPDSARTDVFAPTDDVFVAPEPTITPGTKAQIEIVDQETDRKVWGAEREVEAGDTGWFVRIEAGTLEPGHYVARLAVDGGGRIERSFRISDARHGGSVEED
jgi:hypothetical protein